uniref:Sulfatase N-terminal domain-containing protein n=1 Tax=Clytia hemisphaerica TaxID=252671 RepID=A0A7M5VA97_9CNID
MKHFYQRFSKNRDIQRMLSASGMLVCLRKNTLQHTEALIRFMVTTLGKLIIGTTPIMRSTGDSICMIILSRYTHNGVTTVRRCTQLKQKVVYTIMTNRNHSSYTSHIKRFTVLIGTQALQAPDSWIRKYNYIQHEGRRKFAAMMGYMDYGIGRVHDALVKTGMINNTVIIFTTDNGGPANGFDANWANNFPLRGVKATLWEGGVRAAGFVHSNLLKKPGRTSMDLIHITDWVPTLVNLAGGSSKAPFDGVDQWSCLSEGLPSAREEILLNIDNDRWMNKALRMGDWKIIQETGTWDGWYAPPGVIGMENTNLVDDTYITFQSQPVVNCGEKPANVSSTCFKKPNFCLFNIIDDPCEYHDLSGKYPELLETMKKRLQFYEDSAVPPRRNETGDPRANPKLHNGVWVPWITLP